MSIIFDSSVLIAGERRGETAAAVLRRLHQSLGDAVVAISAISVVELTHGVYRGVEGSQRDRRRSFVNEITRDIPIHAVSLGIAQLAGRMEGEQAALGVAIGFEDLMIGATALYLGCKEATLNVKHFRLIPGLLIVTPAEID